MTGPEHYLAAQREIGLRPIPGQLLQEPADELDVATAQVHAVLALTAAVIDAANAIVIGKRVDDEWCVIGEHE